MPPLPDVAYVARFIIVHKNAVDVDIMNRFYCKFSSVDTLGDAQCLAVAENALGQFGAQFTDQTHPDLSLVSCRVTNLTSPTAGDAIYTTSGTAGTASGGPLPAGVAVLVNYTVGRRYRGGKPRAYLPLLTDASVSTPGHWDPTALANLASRWAAFDGAVFNATVSSVVFNGQVNVSYYSGVEPPITLPSGRVKQSSSPRAAAIVDPITAVSFNPMYGSQRRRNRASA